MRCGIGLTQSRYMIFGLGQSDSAAPNEALAALLTPETPRVSAAQVNGGTDDQNEDNYQCQA
jgi:hypothetical protein